MLLTRRSTLQLGLKAAASLAAVAAPFGAWAQPAGDRYPIDGGEITINPIAHASFVMRTPSLTIYNDPTGPKSAYEGHPAPDLILITHQHEDHFQPATLTAIVGADTRLVVNPVVMRLLPEELKAKATALANGEKTSVGSIEIEAIPAYNTTKGRKGYHPQGRDNGYVLTLGGKRVYIAGDTEDIPEMRALKDIYIAFVPMNLPYTMDLDQAASAVAAFKPEFVYPYHHSRGNMQAFIEKVAAAAPDTKVVLGKWYD